MFCITLLYWLEINSSNVPGSLVWCSVTTVTLRNCIGAETARCQEPCELSCSSASDRTGSPAGLPMLPGQDESKHSPPLLPPDTDDRDWMFCAHALTNKPAIINQHTPAIIKSRRSATNRDVKV